MCFSPQRRAILQHLNFKKWSETLSFFTFWLGNVLLATAACNFSTSQLQKAVRSWCVLYIFTSKCASHHSGVLFLISPLTTWLRTRRFNEPTFRLTRHTNHWKNTAFRDFSNIWRGWIFVLLTFALLHLLSSDSTSSSDFLSSDFTSSICFSSAFQLSILSEVYYLNFLRPLHLLLLLTFRRIWQYLAIRFKCIDKNRQWFHLKPMQNFGPLLKLKPLGGYINNPAKNQKD